MGVGTGPSLTFRQPRSHHRCPPKLHVCQWSQEEHRPLRAGPVPSISPPHRGKLGGLGGMSSPSHMEDSKPVHATEGPHLQGSGRGTRCPNCCGGRFLSIQAGPCRSQTELHVCWHLGHLGSQVGGQAQDTEARAGRQLRPGVTYLRPQARRKPATQQPRASGDRVGSTGPQGLGGQHWMGVLHRVRKGL